MKNQNLAKEIEKKALEIGFLGCGIVPVEEALSDYAMRLDERYARFPDDRQFKAESNYKLGRPKESYPWAEAVVVCTIGLADYRLPEKFQHRIGRIYAFDFRHEERAQEYGWEKELGNFMTSLGIRHASDPNRGIVPLRHVAAKAGLGMIRRNNFLYVPEHGSYVVMAAWLIDQPLRLVHEDSQKPCPPNCRKCREACPTGSLEAPYAMHRRKCVNPATCKYPEGADVTKEDIGLHMEGWLYGCDLCQEACPFNQKKWETKREFPGLDEFEPYLDPEKLLSLPDDFLREHFQPRFWYLPKEVTPWKWKVNAICALLKERGEDARTLIEPFVAHEQEELRKTALWALEKLGGKG